ncbi:DUF2268 domain-containing putative Zn-dependent protease [Sphingopyxis sp. SE2]|uniref:DUF2268 domain-containing putative Zn-dependent protease n=1 Tax=unclassified Sphingopyxis TaxID=2614943 RepID=UPI00050E9DA7|nr:MULTISPECIES: DUF2268 domain-containing putative Zn-dependent protease [unclassified Sphingopyxis]KGB57925.1 hypothetical protein FG95_01400 [Sphingopyxis sp. LC363]MDT7529667.1 DUF2268 domain-containing putative Zn-dependent protease [Sphingopyxis sp. SE2]
MRPHVMMKGLFGAALLAAIPAHAHETAEAPGGGRVTIATSDVDRFYALYDDPALAAQPEVVAARYLATPSPGLAEFMVMRRITPEKLAAALGKKPQVFADARGCAANLPAVRTRLVAATDRLAQIYPAAKFPPITIAIGRATTAGTANAKGLYIGLEALCAAKFVEADDEDRFVHVIAHEYVHVQQPLAQVEDREESVLRAALVEGAAEFVAERMTGSVAYPLLHQWAKGREKELETIFLAEKDQKAIGSRWLYNQKGADGWPGDLGYWVGYRVAKAYYDRTPDKAAAIKAIVEMKDPAAFLAESGWSPGIGL